MPDRRRDKRYKLTERTEGVLRTFLDALVQRTGPAEWVALSRDPAMPGETLLLDIDPAEADPCVRHRFVVGVIDSSPVVADGDIRHQIRLKGDAMPSTVVEARPGRTL